MSPLARSVFDLAVLITIWFGVFEPWKHRGVRLVVDCVSAVVFIAAWMCGMFDWLDSHITHFLGYGR
jgi:hypothetical protein